MTNETNRGSTKISINFKKKKTHNKTHVTSETYKSFKL